MADLTSIPEENYNRSPFIRRDPMRRRYLNEPVLLTFFLTFVAIALSGWALKQNKMVARSIPITGTVTASRVIYSNTTHDSHSKTQQDTRYETVITYTDPKGIGHTFISHIGYKVGQKVDLILDEDDFSVAKTGTAEFNSRANNIVVAFSLLFPLTSGAWSVLRWRTKEKCRLLMKHGKQIEAEIVEELRQATSYETDDNTHRRGRGGLQRSRVLSSERYWRLSYRDPETGRTWSFLSYFGNFPEGYDAVGKVATVYVDRNDFNNYYVDLKSIRDPSLVSNAAANRKNVPTW